MAQESSAASELSALCQVGAIALRFESGSPEILLLTSRETKRWVIPKGWPMKGLKNWAAAAKEAEQEAGIVGRPRKKPVGSFLYFKRRKAHFDLCRVEVNILEYEKRLPDYREKGQRQVKWFPIHEAADQVAEPGLTALLRELDFSSLRKSLVKKPAGSKARKKAKK